VKEIVSNIYWGSLIGLKSTGHGYRASYRALPEISYTNIVIKEGDVKLSEILEGEKPYLLVDYLQGAHSSNPESGEFSVAAPCAWIVYKGERKPLKGIMLSGNVYEALKDISLTAEKFTILNFISPYFILRKSINIISR